MEGKICLVTGANKGIGRETCLALAAQGAEVVMSARNRDQVEAVRDKITEITRNTKVHLLLADLSKPEDVVELSNSFKARFPKLDVLINNAGIFLSDYTENHLGIETQWMVNHLASYLLTRRLLDLMKQAPEARVINVSSNAHLKGRINFEDLNGKSNYHGLKAYSQSKLANVLFTKELSIRLAGSSVSAFALHPGVVRTGIGNRNNNSWMGLLWNLGKPFMISAQKGAETTVYLATTPQLAGLSGLYFIKSQPHPTSELSMDRELATKLWRISEQAVKDYL